jgi:hypothetical protein
MISINTAMSSKTKSVVYARRVAKLLGSSFFFRLVVVWLVLQAAWIALTGRYPMAFDEDYHLGIIRLYSHHLNPFWSSQPEDADRFGAVFRDPSYLYHYLMSFPYRLISLFTSSQVVQVVILRAINIGLFATALPLYRRLLLKTGASKAMVHFCLAIFVLLPVVPLLAAQINYDNLLLPVTALTMLLAIKINNELRRSKRVNEQLILLLIICFLGGSLVKFAFLPIALAVFIWLAVAFWRTYRRQQALHRELRLVVPRLKAKTSWLLIGLVLIGGLLFSERYVINLVRYHAPVPDCDKALSAQQCSAYGPWLRDYTLKAQKADFDNVVKARDFPGEWFYGMWLRTFFAVDGPATNFQTRGPLPVPGIAALVFFVFTALVTVTQLRKLFKRYNKSVLWLFLAVSGLYLVSLWSEEYKAFIVTGKAVAINGRYLLPVLPLLFVIGVLAVNKWFKRRPDLKAGLAALALICVLWGGGALTYILRSNDAWYWQNSAVKSANHAVQKTLGPITPGYSNPTQFLDRN